jgi:hypothetical protein
MFAPRLVITKLLAASAATAGGGALLLFLASIPGLQRLPGQSRVSLDGIITIDDAVQACRRSGRDGWQLVEFAQNLAARKFTYSRRNPWDRPARAFERGMGYCQQQALALKLIYDKLGIEARPVFASRCKFPPSIIHGIAEPARVSGHTWLRVRIGDEVRDVCSGRLDNRPGAVHFQVMSEVRSLSPWIRPFTHLGSVLVNIVRDRQALQMELQQKRSVTISRY